MLHCATPALTNWYCCCCYCQFTISLQCQWLACRSVAFTNKFEFFCFVCWAFVVDVDFWKHLVAIVCNTRVEGHFCCAACDCDGGMKFYCYLWTITTEKKRNTFKFWYFYCVRIRGHSIGLPDGLWLVEGSSVRY